MTLPSSDNFRQGSAINASGEVSGSSDTGTGALWTPSAAGYSLTNLGDVNAQGSEVTFATGINDLGAVVGAGWDFYGGGGWTSFLWKPAIPNGTSGTLISLGKLSQNATPTHSINNSGQIALSGDTHALLWNPTTPNGTTGRTYDLGSLTGPSGTSVSADINSKGQIVGTSRVGNSNHGFLWTPTTSNGVTGTMIDLGDLPNDQLGSKAFAINAAGTVVGKSGENINSGSTQGNATLWTAAQGLQNLNDLVDQSGSAWDLTEAVDINAQGWIIGYGFYDPNNDGGASATYESFLLTPVPEPACLPLMILGTTALRVRKRIRRDDGPKV